LKTLVIVTHPSIETSVINKRWVLKKYPENGFPIAPTMALLIGGAGASLPEIIMLKSIFRKKLASALLYLYFLWQLYQDTYS
jgi:uncharacterized membrane protein YraQ (UPF0718 family)